METNRDEERMRTRIKVAILEGDAGTRQYVAELVARAAPMIQHSGSAPVE
jgi:hypothetical protein